MIAFGVTTGTPSSRVAGPATSEEIMKTLRREFLKCAGGFSAGLILTPVPWKVLDDVSIWTQNWHMIPRPLRGEITQKFTNCTLCPAACGVRAKCVAKQPYQLAGIARHPAGRQTLCPAGLGAHQLPYAPERVTHVLFHGRQTTLEAAIEHLKGRTSVLIVDGRPGRCASAYYRRVASELPDWSYAIAPGGAGALAAFREVTGRTVGLDVEHVKTLLSFGLPVLHGWSIPGRLLQRRPEYRLIQIEPSQTRTAAFADVWLPIKRGSEAAVAQAIARVLVDRKLTAIDDGGATSGFPSPEQAAQAAGIPADKIVEVAQALVTGSPGVAMGTGTGDRQTELAIATVNMLLGDKAALTSRRSGIEGRSLDDVADGSVSVLITDAIANIPSAVLRRKLARDGLLVAVAGFRGELTAHADLVIPAPAWLESEEEVPGPPDAAVASFSVAPPLLPAREGAATCAEVVARLSGIQQTETVTSRIEALHDLRTGTLFRYGDGTSTPVSELKLDEFASGLSEGGCWLDDPQPFTPVCKLPAEMFEDTHRHTQTTHVASVGPAIAPVPMLRKLWVESKLYGSGKKEGRTV
jgi:hypothetical protein